MALTAGDVLVSRSSGRAEHEISVAPAPPHVSFPSHDVAVAKAIELARARGVDAWLTEDHIHYVLVASYRQASCG